MSMPEIVVDALLSAPPLAMPAQSQEPKRVR
jgi:hypothetical protein